MRILMVGDVVGKSGRTALADTLPELKSEYKADFIVVNGENAAAGIGITPEIASGMLKTNEINVITLGIIIPHRWQW